MGKTPLRNLIAFWIFGLANNFVYVIMLSAAEDIISRQAKHTDYDEDDADALLSAGGGGVVNLSVCQEKITERNCNHLSTGAVLLADILPCLIIKIICPFFMHRIPFGIRHFCVCLCQIISFIIVAFSTTIEMSLLGVCFASLASGFGESCYLALAAHYSKNAISFWSSGTGGAGITGSVTYATLTEPKMFGLNPRQALLSMLIVPITFAATYWFLLTPSASIQRAKLMDPSTWIVPKRNASTDVMSGPPKDLHRMVGHNNNNNGISNNNRVATIEAPFSMKNENYMCNTMVNGTGGEMAADAEKRHSLATTSTWSIKSGSRIYLVLPLLRYMIPLTVVYFAEYLINQGIVELFVFDCAHGFNLPQPSQYRWYMVLYQTGVFISRSSVNFIELSANALYALPVLQCLNLVLFFFNAIYSFIPHIGMVFAFILFEGFFGGASYVNTFNRIHKEAPHDGREFCLSVATLSDSVGTMFAGVMAFPLHNFICSLTA